MNCAQNEKRGAAKKKVKRLATVQACRNIRIQQQGRAKRGVPAGATLRPLKGTAAKANALPKRPAKAVGAKLVGAKPVKPKLIKVPQVDHDDSDTNSVASTSRAKRTPAKGKPEDAEAPDKKTVKRAESNEGVEGLPAKKGTPAGPVEGAPKKKVTKVVRKLVSKNNIKKNKLKPGNPSILKYLTKPVDKAKQLGNIVGNVKAKTKWVVALKEGTKAISRRSQGLGPEEGRSDSPTTTKKLKGTLATTKKRKEDAGEETQSEQESELMEVVDEERETEAAALETVVATPTDSVRKPAVRKASISGNSRVTRSQGDRILRNGKSSKVKKILQLADARKPRRSKTDEDVKSPVGEEVLVDSKNEADLEKPEEKESQLEALSEESNPGVPEVEPETPLPDPLKSAMQSETIVEEPKVLEAVPEASFEPVSPFTPEEEVTRFTKGEEAELEPKAAVAVTTPLSPVSPVANSILSNKNFTDTNSNVCTNSVKENRKPPDVEPLKTVDTIINDWDSDEDAQGSLRDGKVPFGNCSPAQVTKENEAPKYKPPNRQVVLLETDKAKVEDKSETDSRNVGMKMPPTTECLLKTNEMNGFADSVELLAKRSSKIDFELLRRRTKRSMSLSVDPNDKLSPNKRTYGAVKPRDSIRTLVSMPKLSPEVDIPSLKSPPNNFGLTDKMAPKSEELFDNLIARTKDETKETDEKQPQETTLEKEDPVGAPNGTCDEDDKKDNLEDKLTSSTPVVSAHSSPVPPVELDTNVPTAPTPEPPDEVETNEKEDLLKQDDDGDASLCSEKRSDDFSLHLTIDSVDENSMDRQLDTRTMDEEIADLPKDEEEVPCEQVQKAEGAVSQDENSSENPLSPPKLKPFDSDSIVDEEEIMAEMVATPEESKEETVEPEKEEPEPAVVAEHKEEDNSNSSEVSESYIQNLIECQEEAEPTVSEEEPKTEVAAEPAKEDETPTEQVTSLQGELSTPKDPEPRSDVQPSARIDCKETCGSSASSLSSILDADTTRLNLDLNLAEIEKKRREIFEEEESPERRAVKEHVLNSLGLQSLRSVAEAAAISTSGTGRSAKRAQRKDSGGTSASSGRLKVVINVPKEKSKPLRMLFKNGKPYPSHPEAMLSQPVVPPIAEAEEGDFEAKNTAANSNLEGNGSADNALLNLSDYRANVGALPDIGASITSVDADGKSKQPGSLVIPEKSSSFSIHPGRLCSDVCSYCFGKFGSLDTPCHIAQLKSRERQMKILSVETQLAMDSCLCDACIRYVDRKANCPSYKPPGGRREKNKYSGLQAVCCVNGCPQSAVHSLRKKWYFKIRKSVAQKCPVNLDLVNPQLPLPLCAEHYSYMDYFMVCGLCKRRLTRSHMYNLTEVREINLCLEADGIPARLSDKLFVCKLCRYYATMRVKHPRSHFTLSANQRDFFNSYRKRILRNHDIAVSGSEDNGDGDPELPKDRSVSPAGEGSCNEEQPKGKRRRARSNPTPPSIIDDNVAVEVEAPKKKARTSGNSFPKSKDKVEQSDSATERTDADKVSDKAKSQPPLRLCLSNVTTNPQSGSAEWVRKDTPPFFPGEDQLALHANIEFPEDVPSKQKDWERCTSTLQFDKETKRLWQELQRPYGSQSSFIRHLVLMERYWRQGELTLTATTDRANSYTRSVQNRLKAYGTTYVSKKVPQAAATPPPPPPPPPQGTVPAPAKPEEKPATPEKAVKPSVSPQPASAAPPPPPKVLLPRLPPKPQAAKSPQTKPLAQPKAPAKPPPKQQKILPKPPAPPTSVWEPIAKNASPNRPFFVSATPVVNLTSSVSLTAVPVATAGVSSGPEISPVNSESVTVGPVRTSRPSSWNSSGGFVSIVPSASTAPQSARVPPSPNVSASITPIFSSSSTNSVSPSVPPSTSVSPTLSPCAGLRVDGKVTTNQGNKSQHLVQVTAGGKSFSLTIAQFKKLQALRQQRQIDQQKKGRRSVGAGANKPKQRRASTTSSATEPTKEEAECEANSEESFVPMICDVRSVTSSDQAITMWDEPERTEECKLNPQLEITPIEASPGLPKIANDLSEMTLTTLVPSRALAADTLTAPGPTARPPPISPPMVQAIAPSLSPSLIAPTVTPILTPPITALPVAPLLPPAVDIFPN